MSTKFVCFINAHTRKPILVNPDHVRTAAEAHSHKTVRLVIGRLPRSWRRTLSPFGRR
jgi:hypothetical protein